MQLTKEIKAAPKAGKLSEEEAQEKRGDEDGAREVKSTQRRYDHAIPKTKEAHQAGTFSKSRLTCGVNFSRRNAAQMMAKAKINEPHEMAGIHRDVDGWASGAGTAEPQS